MYYDEYLTEKAPRGAYKKYIQKKTNDFNKELDKNDEMKKNGLADDDDREKIWKKHDAEDYRLFANHGITIGGGAGGIRRVHNNERNWSDKVKKTDIESAKKWKKYMGQGKNNIPKDREPGEYLKRQNERRDSNY